MAVRNEMATELALGALLPFLLLVPLLAVFIAIVIERSLRPLKRLAAAIESRSPDILLPLEVGSLPPELQPMLTALNDLLARLKAAAESQRAFVADAAHELRTPLTALKLQLQLAERASNDGSQQESFAKLRLGLDRSVHLVQQLLALARQESPAGSPAHGSIDLVGVARQVVADLSTLAETRQIDLGLEAGTDSVEVQGDSESLTVLLVNLVDNAIRYTSEGGRVDVVVATENDEATVRVIDNGPGIPAAERERVFDRFYRRPGVGEGSGLGLAIAKTIARRHNATLSLESNPSGQGLSAIVRFPRS
ncbi:MAG: ATP-binding protein [bacterium]